MRLMPTRPAVLRFIRAADAYRKAFAKVQRRLRALDDEAQPKYVFAIDTYTLDEVAEIDPELRDSEEHRRRSRAALHALAELIALHDPGEQLPTHAEDTMITALSDPTGDDMRRLDAFISVVQTARDRGCVFVNGTFEPLIGSPDQTDDSDVTLIQDADLEAE